MVIRVEAYRDRDIIPYSRARGNKDFISVNGETLYLRRASML